MEGISKSLEQFTTDSLEAHRFLNQARRYFQSVTFTAVSSLGSQPRNGEMEEQIAPRRVLDPLLWVLSKSAVIFEEPLPKQVAPTVSNETGPAPRHAPQNIPIPQIGSNAFKQSVPWVLGVLICLAIALGLALRSNWKSALRAPFRSNAPST